MKIKILCDSLKKIHNYIHNFKKATDKNLSNKLITFDQRNCLMNLLLEHLRWIQVWNQLLLNFFD